MSRGALYLLAVFAPVAISLLDAHDAQRGDEDLPAGSECDSGYGMVVLRSVGPQAHSDRDFKTGNGKYKTKTV